jgi:ATP-dependent Lhr-like helicase
MAKSSKSTADAVFSGIVRQWLQQSFSGLTRVQQMGWPVVAGGHHVLLSAPTGSGKTLAAFLWGIDTLLRLQPRAEPGVRVLYVSPLKALVYDVERNLRAPLAGIGALAAESGQDVRDVRVDVRTGDSSQAERRRQAREPADILVTTPESLYLLLGSKARQTLSSVHTVIVDEVHALAPFKRGAHLALSLERLEELAQRPPQRIGLSATVRPLEAAARFLAGDRPVEIVDAGQAPNLDLQVVVPVSDMERPVVPDARPPSQVPFPAMDPAKGAMAVQRGIWPSIHERLLEEIETSRSAILFVNSRGLCERLVQRLNELAGQPLVLAHHGSLSHARRAEIEDGLKSGRVRAIVATSSLELGVDMGAVDRVLLVESPGSVARGLQRVGRAGHQVGALSIGRIYPKFRADLLECAVVAQRMLTGEIESMRVPANPLDVLAQQLVALCCDHPRSPAQILALVRRAWPYRGLGEEVLARVLDMLTGRYPSTGMADLRPLLNWDRAADRLSPRRAAPMVSRLNGGTIPDRGSYAVHIAPDGPRIGELDEEMVYETRNGDVVTLGASSWRVEEITRDRVLVSPAPGEPGRLPFWHGDATGRPLELGRALGVMLRRLKRMSVSAARDWLLHNTPLDERAAANLADYLAEQKQLTGTLPDDRSVLVERFRDELGDWRLCILTPFGARIHAPWAMAIQRQLERSAGFEVQLLYSDDGIALRLADSEELPDVGLLLPDPAEVRDLVTEQLADSALFAALFRENAARSLLMPRRTVKGRRPLWAQRLKSQQILAAVRGFPDFPVLMETYRQCLADHFDMDGLEGILRDLHNGAIRLAEVQTPRPSPFARSLVFAYVANYIYEQDAPPAERKAQALTLDRRLLAELLGQDELRNLIDPQVLEDLELELQCLTEDRQVRDADGLHDLLRRLGDLSEQEIQDRSQSGTAPWLAQLSRPHHQRHLRTAARPPAGWRATA